MKFGLLFDLHVRWSAGSFQPSVIWFIVFFLSFSFLILGAGYVHLLLKIASRRSGLEATQWVDPDPANWAGSRQYLQEQHGHVRLCWHVGNETAGKCGRPSEHSIPAPAKVPQQSGLTLLQFVSGTAQLKRPAVLWVEIRSMSLLPVCRRPFSHFLMDSPLIPDPILLSPVRPTHWRFGGAHRRRRSALRTRQQIDRHLARVAQFGRLVAPGSRPSATHQKLVKRFSLFSFFRDKTQRDPSSIGRHSMWARKKNSLSTGRGSLLLYLSIYKPITTCVLRWCSSCSWKMKFFCSFSFPNGSYILIFFSFFARPPIQVHDSVHR